MKLSVSLPDSDVEFLDDYARTRGYESRSAVVQQAVRLLRTSELESDYAAAWVEWSSAEEHDGWAATIGDGLGVD